MSKLELRTLRVDSIIKTAEILHRRIEERFPERNFKNISAEVVKIAQEARERIKAYSQPNYWLRSLIVLALLLFIAGIYVALRQLNFDITNQGLFDLIAAIEAGINDAVFLGAAIFFLITLEQRLKQRKIKVAMQELRSLAHVIDVYQVMGDDPATTNKIHKL